MLNKKDSLLSALLFVSASAMANPATPVIGLPSTTPNAVKKPATTGTAQLKPVVLQPMAVQNKPVAVAPPPEPAPLAAVNLDQAKQMADLTRQNALAEVEVKLLENKKKILELRQTIANGGMPIGQLKTGGMLNGFDSQVNVLSVVGFDGKDIAEISSASGKSRYKVGDTVPMAGKIKAISINNVKICGKRRCHDYAVNGDSIPMKTQQAQSTPSMPTDQFHPPAPVVR
ncbi:hypothetical protein QU487_06870 [Crenobacter sp. SG2305]|uniref:hypothetical protein n=1 Tax=Crenobacter oryzisoli TaxID=3056844 RepID=UPI0025AB4F97|nr:hypothetical protein [Crenobacter sp. SG2305]MDN0082477.1 hypothetical protein [Crenobacter sp. SG2305]